MPLLHWLTRDQDIQTAAKVPHRILQEVPELSYGEPSQNLLVQGDNLEALKALLPFYAGQVKCIFIDPPYNTGAAFVQYDDALEHSKWLSLIVPRLALLREFLHSSGSIFISVDDNEAHYLKVICDEIFGRRNFVANVVWQKKYTVANDAKWLSSNHDHVLVYCCDADVWAPNRLPRSDEMNARYRNPDNHPKGPWKATPLHAKSGSAKGENFSFTFKNGVSWSPPAGTFPRFSVDTLRKLDDEDAIWFGANGLATPSRKTFLVDLAESGPPSPTIWLSADVGHNHEARDEVKAFNPADPFSTPKPERLIQRILTIATNPGDLVLDSFLGSGTTAAVAHKMGRRWIGVEMGDHAKTHCATRLHKVIDGEQGGISKDVDWKGGGGFRFCTLGPTIFDEQGRINPEIKFPELARHLWFVETKTPMATETVGTIIGTTEKMAYALLYNGILQDRTPNGGNVLTSGTLKIIREDLEKARPDFEGEIVIYAAASRIGPDRLRAEGIIFKQTPYDISARG